MSPALKKDHLRIATVNVNGLRAAYKKGMAEWLEARETLEEFKSRNKGSYYVKTPNGYEQPHQSFYVAEKLRRELLQYLPECCLTIPSFANVRGKLGDDGQQDLQFGDLVGHANEDRKNYSRR